MPELLTPLPTNIVGDSETWNMISRRLNYSARAPQYLGDSLRGPRESQSVPLLGVEFETNTGYHVSELVKGFHRPFAICKSDSSINGSFENNYEIVTLPATLRMQRIHWKNFFSHFDPTYFSSRENTGGVHVHVSRNLMDDGHMRRFCWFFVSPYNTRLIFKLSERTASTIGQWASFPAFRQNSRNFTKLSQLITILPEFLSHKYSLVNTNPRHTIEIRAFKSVPHQTNLLKNIEIVDAVYNFTKDRSINSLDTPAFFEWLNTLHRNKYFYLKKFIQENGGYDSYLTPWTQGLTRRQLLNVDYDPAIHANLAA